MIDLLTSILVPKTVLEKGILLCVLFFLIALLAKTAVITFKWNPLAVVGLALTGGGILCLILAYGTDIVSQGTLPSIVGALGVLIIGGIFVGLFQGVTFIKPQTGELGVELSMLIPVIALMSLYFLSMLWKFLRELWPSVPF